MRSLRRSTHDLAFRDPLVCGMKQSGWIKRKTPLRSRGRSRFPKRRDPGYLARIRGMPCTILTHSTGTCSGITEPAHVRIRGAGGDDVGNVIPLCQRHHRIQHDAGIQTFQLMYNIDMAEIARELAGRLTAVEGEWSISL